MPSVTIELTAELAGRMCNFVHTAMMDGGRAAVFSQGDSADSVFYIQKGKVKVSVVSAQGKEAVLAETETSSARAA